MKTAKSIVPLHIWCGAFDFPIENPIIFGRVCNRKRHKGGHYHFGPVEYGMTRFVSDIDVSTICIPYKEVTYFQIDQFVYPPKKHCRAIYSLINVLKELSNL